MILWKLSWNIRAPIDALIAQNRERLKESDFVPLQDTEDMEALKQKDTDKDGLNDYEEIYIYKTSPYLEDSDSDKIKDKDEIQQGLDPLCATGQDCYSQTLGQAEKPAFNLEDLVGAIVPDQPLENPFAGLSEDQVKRMLSGQAAPAEIREILKQAGMTQEALDTLQDEQLQEAYQKLLGDAVKVSN
ncbi:MAG: hypothetical protein HY602_01805 [Parcubacteria group bacterium]|nr:hypothetical protein [Parcubacteria group bacterium]